MAWVRIEDGMPEHRKIAGLTDRAFRAEFEALCFANRNLTDGLLTTGQIKPWRRAAAELVAARLWDEDPEGFRIHDYLLYNPSREQVLAQREEAHASKVAGGKKRAENAARDGGRFTSSATSSPPAAAPAENQQATSPDPDPDPDPEKKQEQEPEKEKSTRKRVTAVDEQFIEQLVGEYRDTLGEPKTRLAIRKALNSKSFRGWTDKRQGVRNWLDGDAEGLAGGGATSGGAGAHAEAARPGAVARNSYGPYRAKPNLTPAGEFGDTWGDEAARRTAAAVTGDDREAGGRVG